MDKPTEKKQQAKPFTTCRDKNGVWLICQPQEDEGDRTNSQASDSKVISRRITDPDPSLNCI